MATLSFPEILDTPTESVRMRELADRLLKSCTRKPIDVQRWHEWKRGRRDLSIEMLQNAVKAGARVIYARAILLQLLADFAEDTTDVPALPEAHRQVVEADCKSDRERQLAMLDGTVTPDERARLEVAITETVRVYDMFLERLRRSVHIGRRGIG